MSILLDPHSVFIVSSPLFAACTFYRAAFIAVKAAPISWNSAWQHCSAYWNRSVLEDCHIIVFQVERL